MIKLLQTVEQGMRLDVFEVANAFYAKYKAGQAPPLSQEEVRSMEFCMRDWRRSGLHLSKDKRDKIEELSKKMNNLSMFGFYSLILLLFPLFLSALEIQFNRNLSEDATTLQFTEAELNGLSKDHLSSLKRSDDGYAYQQAFQQLHLSNLFPLLPGP